MVSSVEFRGFPAMTELERLGVLPWQVLDAEVSRVDTSGTEETVDLIHSTGDQDDVRAG
jgi:hypothetical protein